VEYKIIILSKEDNIATIVFNRPDKLNALSTEMLQEINAALDEVAKDRSLRVLIITARGKVFCAGADLREPIFTETSPSTTRRHLAMFHSIPIKLRALSIPVIASVAGPAVGAGANIALACDIIIASKETQFGQVFINIGEGDAIKGLSCARGRLADGINSCGVRPHYGASSVRACVIARIAVEFALSKKLVR
jgi:enoyl-CoA hydratase/carnithine racemase